MSERVSENRINAAPDRRENRSGLSAGDFGRISQILEELDGTGAMFAGVVDFSTGTGDTIRLNLQYDPGTEQHYVNTGGIPWLI